MGRTRLPLGLRTAATGLDGTWPGHGARKHPLKEEERLTRGTRTNA